MCLQEFISLQRAAPDFKWHASTKGQGTFMAHCGGLSQVSPCTSGTLSHWPWWMAIHFMEDGAPGRTVIHNETRKRKGTTGSDRAPADRGTCWFSRVDHQSFANPYSPRDDIFGHGRSAMLRSMHADDVTVPFSLGVPRPCLSTWYDGSANPRGPVPDRAPVHNWTKPWTGFSKVSDAL